MISPEALFDISMWLVLAIILIGVALLVLAIITSNVEEYLSLDFVIIIVGVSIVILIWCAALILSIIRWLN